MIEILREDPVDRGRVEGVSFQANETTHFAPRILCQVVSIGAKHYRDCIPEALEESSRTDSSLIGSVSHEA